MSTVITFVRSIVSYVVGVSFTEMFCSEWSPAQRVLHEDELVVSPIHSKSLLGFFCCCCRCRRRPACLDGYILHGRLPNIITSQT